MEDAMRKYLMLLTAAAIVVTGPVAANAGGKGGGSISATAHPTTTHQDFTFTKYQDAASPKLYNFHNGTHIPKTTVYDKHKDW
jgi:type VI protein secretion system component Hcp